MSSLPNRRPVTQATRALFDRLHGKFNDNIVREIVLASAGLKASRTCLNEAEVDRLLKAARGSDLKAVISDEKYVHRKDIGKGGWSNSLQAVVPAGHPDGLYNVYMASGEQLVEKGMSMEELSDDNGFGSLLGIPRCCIDAYIRFHPIAKLKQNDFVPLVLGNTSGSAPYRFWNNYVAQYFGRTLLSFFPCSFNCLEAEKFARTTFTILQHCSSAWAEGFVKLQRANVLYTEYLGLHMLAETSYCDGWIDYDARLVQSTEITQVREQIDQGNRLRVLGKREVEIYDGGKRVCKINGEDVSMCIFN